LALRTGAKSPIEEWSEEEMKAEETFGRRRLELNWAGCVADSVSLGWVA